MPSTSARRSTKGPSSLERRSAVLAVILGIICLGAALRLYRIDHQSIWWDEAITLTVARAPLADMPRYFKSDGETPTPLFGWKGRPSQVWEFNPPLYFAALHGWCGLFGFGPLQARLMSATAGILSLPILFLIGVRLFETRLILLC